MAIAIVGELVIVGVVCRDGDLDRGGGSGGDGTTTTTTTTVTAVPVADPHRRGA